METSRIIIDGIEVFECGSFGTYTQDNQTFPIRFFKGIPKNIVESGLLYKKLEQIIPEINNHQSLFTSLLQLYRFSVGSFEGEQRKDNPLGKYESALTSKSFNPQNLKQIGIYEDYFGGEIFTEDNIEELFKIFRLAPNNKLLIDDVLYEDSSIFNISNKGYLRYVSKKLNLSVELWQGDRLNSYKEIKSKLIEKSIWTEKEKARLEGIKDKFISLFNITENIYTINKDKINSSIELELLNLKKNLDNALEEALKHSREGKRKAILQNFVFLLGNYDNRSIEGKVDSLNNVFDLVIDDKIIFKYLIRRLEKFNNLLLGRFYRIILPELKIQENLSRIELRLYILMNLPLNFFNYHPTDEKIILQFLAYNPNIQSRFFKTLILRERGQNDLDELVKLFYSYLKTYQVLIPLYRDYDDERKYEARHKTISIEHIDNNSTKNLKGYNRDKMGDESQNDDDIDDEESLDTEYDKNEEEENTSDARSKRNAKKPELTVKPKNKRFRDQYYRENSIRIVEVNDFLDVAGLDSIENQIIILASEGLNYEQIGTELENKVTKQAIHKKFIKLRKKFPEPKKVFEFGDSK